MSTKIKQGVLGVATIVHNRGDCEMWGAEGPTLDDCIALVEQVVESGQEIIDGEGDYDSLQDLLQEELGLEPDYIMDLWLM